MAQDQRQRALSHSAKSHDQHLAWEGSVFFVRTQRRLSDMAAEKLPERLYPKAAAIAIRRAAQLGLARQRIA
jgi:hypothetical protein